MRDDRFSRWDVVPVWDAVPVPAGAARVRAIVMLAIAAVITVKALGAAPAPPSAPTAPMERLTATVNAIDSRAGTIDLLTGVGHALRIVRIHVPPRIQMRDVHGAVPMSALEPGCIVYVEYERTQGGMVASTLELREARPRGAKP